VQRQGAVRASLGTELPRVPRRYFPTHRRPVAGQRGALSKGKSDRSSSLELASSLPRACLELASTAAQASTVSQRTQREREIHRGLTDFRVPLPSAFLSTRRQRERANERLSGSVRDGGS